MNPLPRGGSLRYRSRPVVRKPSFRDDTNLVAIRYEKTSQGDAPIPVRTVNPIRAPSRPASAASSSPSPTSTGRSPVVVRPPPAEDHPALRQKKKGSVLDGKRDSGHAPASLSSTTPTINEEDCEDDLDDDDSSSSSSSSSFYYPQPPSPLSGKNSCGNNNNLGAILPSCDTTARDLAAAPALTTSTRAATPNQHSPPPTTNTGHHHHHHTRVLPPSSSPSSSSSSTSSSSSPRTRPRPRSVSTSVSELRTVETAATSIRLSKSLSLRSWSRPVADTGLGLDMESAAGPAAAAAAAAAAAGAEARGPNGAETTAPDATETSSSSPVSTSHHRHSALPQPSSPAAQSPRSWRRRIGPFSSPKSTPQPRRDHVDDNNHHHVSPSFVPLSLSLPSHDDDDDDQDGHDFLAGLTFSNRGSVILDGHRALPPPDAAMDSEHHHPPAEHDEAAAPSTANNNSNNTTQDHETTTDSAPPPPAILVVPAAAAADDTESESRKVRSLYAVGDHVPRWEDGASSSSLSEQQQQRAATPIVEDVAEEDELAANDPSREESEEQEAPAQESSRSSRSNNNTCHHPPVAPDTSAASVAASSSSPQPPSGSAAAKRLSVAAGGFEDYDDLDGLTVDRYGFITSQRPASSRAASPADLKSAQLSPRRRNVLTRRDRHDGGGGGGGPSSSPLSGGGRRPPTRKISTRSLYTQHSGVSTTSLRSSRSVLRQAGNLLPHNRHRRWMDEAGDMLTVSPSLQDMAEEAEVERISEALKRKEWERSEKWRRMARLVRRDARGGGMEFEFDVANPKLVERTWKGVPDNWRSAAWWSFLDVAARNHPGSPPADAVIADFHRLQDQSSPDDVQIDLDVPRTISRHIMFRRRYQGGQRLLFRVLHALSIYFPVTGYVQGMASLAATLLCYFDEDRCFVMLVRMWQLRGLDRLYRPGFEGLMTALDEFEGTWLHKDVASKLEELGVDKTAYGTRWYLTLFNLSIPFAAQLRVWDVFLLLDEQPTPATTTTTLKTPSPTGLDVLHATGAALIQALREVILDSDFENAMKALTSFTTIKDEDLLMKVTKAEWKAHHGKRKI